MKTRLCLLFAAVLLTGAAAAARQTDDPARVKARTVTLVSARRGDRLKSVFNFQHGAHGRKRRAPNPNAVNLKGLPDNAGVQSRNLGGGPPHPADVGETGSPYQRASSTAPGWAGDGAAAPRDSARRDRRDRSDIRFGGLTYQGGSDWFDIADHAGAHSAIKDLGAMRWEDVTQVPVLPPSPEPHSATIVFTRGRVVSPRNVFVRAVAGHMYLLRVKDGEADYQVLFRVESLDPNRGCKLTWKRFKTPKS